MSLNLAYEVSAGDVADVLFSISTAHAKELFRGRAPGDACELTCARARWADQYAESGVIPAVELVSRGYKVRCACCGDPVSEDAGACFDGGLAFCSSACQRVSTENTLTQDEACSEAAEVAKELWPKARIIKVVMVDGRARVQFAFGQPERPAFWFVDSDEVQVAPVDRCEWISFNEQMRIIRSQQ